MFWTTSIAVDNKSVMRITDLLSNDWNNCNHFKLSEKEKAIQEERRLFREKARLEKQEKERIKAQVSTDQ